MNESNAPSASPPLAQPPPADSITVEDLVRQLQRLALFLWRHRWKLILLPLVGATLGVVSVLLWPGNPQAYCEVRLVMAITENPVEKFDRRNLAFFRTPEQSFTAIPLVRRTLQAMGNAEPNDSDLKAIRDRLSFFAVADKTYRATFRSSSGQDGVAFLQAHLTTFLNDEIAKTLGTLEAEARFLKASIERIGGELRASEEAVRRFKEDHADGLPEQAREHYLLLRNLERQEVEVQAKLEQLSLELKLNREKLSGEKLFVESKVISTQRAQPFLDAMTKVRTQLAEAESAGMTEAHPEMARLRHLFSLLEQLHNATNLAQTDTSVEQARNPIFESIQDVVYQLEVQEMVRQNELKQVRSQLERAREIVKQLPELESAYSELTRTYDSASALYQRMLQQLRVTELQFDLEKASATARSDIITPPRLELVSWKKQFILRAGVLTALGFALAIAWACIVELWPVIQRVTRTARTEAAA